MKKKICLAVITALIIIGNIQTVQALTASELEQKRIDLKSKIDEAGKNLENINVELTENLEEISKLDEEIYTYEEQIQNTTQNLQNIEAQIKKAEEYLKTIEKRYEQQKKILEKRLTYAYEAGETRYLDVLLNSKSIVEFISNYYMIGEMVQYDKDLLDSIGRERNQIEQIEEGLKASRENLKVVKTEQKKVAVLLENAKAVKNSYINKLTNEEQGIKSDIKLYQNELDLVELEILISAMEGRGSQYVGGTFAWPTPGYYTITSNYGMRLHPILKTFRKHTGLDIGAPKGSYAVAANDGIVIKSTYSYSYGNMVMIDHGGGVSTLYAHGSETIARVGDVVKRGEAIMKVGSTGWSTGPHLHFEIRINGQTIDPYPYLVSNHTRNTIPTSNTADTNITNDTNLTNNIKQ